MLYGFTGSSGTGKTTLAKSVAESLGIEYMSASITEIANRYGFNAVGPMLLQDRIHLQWALLREHLEMLKNAPRPLVVDRTPLDFIGYMYAEIDMHSHMRLSASEINEIEDYRQTCLSAAVLNYDHIFVAGQLATYEVKSSRPADNRAYQTHSQMIMEAAAYSLTGSLSFTIMRETDRDEREAMVHDKIMVRLDEIEKAKKSSPYMH